MKKILSKIVLTAIFAQNIAGIFLGANNLQAYAVDKTPKTNTLISVSTLPEKVKDSRVIALEKVFAKYNSPLVPLAQTYVDTADKYGIDWKLLPAISGLESSFGVYLMPSSHNAYGWGGGYIYFTSWEEGIDKINATLKSNYYNRGANTVWTIGPIYAESPTWAVRVNNFMEQIAFQYAKIESQKVTLTI